MANFVQQTTISPKLFVAAFSRYLNSTVEYYGDNNLLTFETYKRQPVPTTQQDKYIVVTPGLEYRPDLLSFDVYGFPDLWWLILQANGLYDIWDFKAGTNIRVPKTIF